jgi:hypothetical protein
VHGPSVRERDSSGSKRVAPDVGDSIKLGAGGTNPPTTAFLRDFRAASERSDRRNDDESAWRAESDYRLGYLRLIVTRGALRMAPSDTARYRYGAICANHRTADGLALPSRRLSWRVGSGGDVSACRREAAICPSVNLQVRTGSRMPRGGAGLVRW